MIGPPVGGVEVDGRRPNKGRRWNARGAIRLGVLALTLSLLAACFGSMKLDMEFAVSADNRVSGRMVVAISREDVDETGIHDEELRRDLPITSVEPYEDDDFVGNTYELDDMTLAEFNAAFGPGPESFFAPDGGGFVISRNGEVLRVRGTVDLRPAEYTPPDPPDEFRIGITFPGAVLETTGTAEGNHVEWDLRFGRLNVLEAEARVPRSRSAVAVGILVLVSVLTALFAGWWLIRRRRSAAVEPEEQLIDQPRPTA
jgi:hypothetical protein